MFPLLDLELGLSATSAGITKLHSVLSKRDLSILTVHGIMLYSTHLDPRRLLFITWLTAFHVDEEVGQVIRDSGVASIQSFGRSLARHRTSRNASIYACGT